MYNLRNRSFLKEIALIFEKSSTRTRCAFEVAAFDQGAHVTYLDPTGSQMGHRLPPTRLQPLKSRNPRSEAACAPPRAPTSPTGTTGAPEIWLARVRAPRLLGELGGGTAGDDDDRDGGVSDDLGRPRAEEDPRDRSDRAGPDDEHVAVSPFDVLERLVPALAVADDGLDLARYRRQVADPARGSPGWPLRSPGPTV